MTAFDLADEWIATGRFQLTNRAAMAESLVRYAEAKGIHLSGETAGQIAYLTAVRMYARQRGDDKDAVMCVYRLERMTI